MLKALTDAPDLVTVFRERVATTPDVDAIVFVTDPGDLTGSAVRWSYAQLDKELDVIEAMEFPGYFLIVHDIVAFATEHTIWCQGRGSAASSVVCYVLCITAVDALKHGLLFERSSNVWMTDSKRSLACTSMKVLRSPL